MIITLTSDMRTTLLVFGNSLFKTFPSESEMLDWIDEINKVFKGNVKKWMAYHEELFNQESKQ